MKRHSRLDTNQEMVVRTFIAGAELSGLVLPPKMLEFWYDQMGYKVAPNGARIWKDIPIAVRYGQEHEWEDTYYADWDEIMEYEAEPDTGASEPTEGN